MHSSVSFQGKQRCPVTSTACLPLSPFMDAFVTTKAVCSYVIGVKRMHGSVVARCLELPDGLS